MKKSPPFYNYLIILIPFLNFLIGNDASTNLYQKTIVILFGLILVFIFFIASQVINSLFPLQNKWMIPFLSISIYFFFSYAQWGLEDRLYAILFLMIPILISVFISKLDIVETFFSTFINAVALVIFLQFTYLQFSQYKFVDEEHSESLQFENNEILTTPNIYLVMLDAYSREDSLLELGFDNSGFIKFLRKNNFFVADKSNANYISTRLSLYTLYMMEYPESDISLKSPKLIEVLKGKNKVTSDLRSIGYKHVRMGPNQSFPQDCSGIEDICLYKINEINGTAYGHGDIYINILSMSPLLKVIRYFGLFEKYVHPNKYEKATIENATKSLQNRSNELARPLFVEINIWQPHAPYIFQDNCKKRQKTILGLHAWIDSSINPYIDEIKCANLQLENFVNHISSSDEDAIIILMSDHGHSFFFDRETPVEDYDDDAMRKRLANLMSVKLPDYCPNYMYPTITPVNLFPIIFSCLTMSQPELVDDLSYKHQLGNKFFSDTAILVDTSDE
jgi:hypothetical protein